MRTVRMADPREIGMGRRNLTDSKTRDIGRFFHISKIVACRGDMSTQPATKLRSHRQGCRSRTTFMPVAASAVLVLVAFVASSRCLAGGQDEEKPQQDESCAHG